MTTATLPYADPAYRRRAAAATLPLVNPLVALAAIAFVASIPFESPSRRIPMEIPTAFGYVLLLASTLNPSACYRRIPAALWGFGLYLWAIVLVTVVVGVANRQLAARLFVTMLQMTLVFWVLANLAERPRMLRALLLTFILACAVRAGMQLLGIATESTALWTGGSRISTLGQNPNLSAIILSAGLVAALGLCLSALDPPRWLRFAVVPLGVAFGVAIIQSGSRGGLLCAAAGVGVFCLRGTTVAARLRNGALAVVGVAALAVGAWRSEMMRHRFEETAQQGRLAGREVIYPAAVELFRERPLLGWGPIENHFEIARRIHELDLPRRDPHNLVLELVTSTGLLGAVPFLVAIGILTHSAVRARDTIAGHLPIALVCCVLAGTISGTWIAAKVLWLSLAIADAGPRLPALRAAAGG
jgi:O-antigen ligase